MGLLSGGNSKNTTRNEGDSPTNNVDYGSLSGFDGSKTLGRGASSNETIWADDGATLNNNTTYNMTDRGAVNSAAETVRAVTRDALGSNEATAKNALASNSVVSETAMVANTMATEKAMAVAENAIAQAQAQAAANTKALQQAMSATNAAAMNANTQMAGLGRYAIDANGNLASESMDRIESIAGDSLAHYEALTSTAFDEVNRANVLAQNGTQTAMDYVFKSTQSADERQSETLIKYGTWGAVAIAVILLLAALAGSFKK